MDVDVSLPREFSNDYDDGRKMIEKEKEREREREGERERKRGGGNPWWRGEALDGGEARKRLAAGHGVRSVAACVRVLFAENVSAAGGIR